MPVKICALSTGKTIRPSDPQSEYIDDFSQVTLVVLSVNGKFKAYTTYGGNEVNGEPYFTVGEVIRDEAAIRNDCRRINGWVGVEVVGIRNPDGTTEGNVPTTKIPHWVAK
jgi:hypothetical protein